MPLLKLQTSVPVPVEKEEDLLKQLSRAVSEAIGKPEQYVMVTLDAGSILMGGKREPAAFIDLRSIGGLGGEVNRSISERVSIILGEALDIPSDRIYITFIELEASDWGYNGSTFG